MSAWSDFAERVRTLLFREREERDLSDEILFHIEMETRKHIDAGYSLRDAKRLAELSLGGSDQTMEHVRDARGTRVLEDVWRDAAYAVRTLIRQPQFAVIMLLILALGIGANTTTFTLVDALLLRSLPVSHPEQLVVLGDASRTGGMSQGTPRATIASYPVYRDLRDGNNVLTGLYASGRGGRIDLLMNADIGKGNAAETPLHPRSRFVSGNFFDLLGVPAYAGRVFTQADDHAPGSDPFVVVSYSYWKKELGGARSVVGHSVNVNGAPMTIIGVAPQSFDGDVVGQPTEMWIPLMMQPVLMPNQQLLEDRTTSWLLMMGRLAPGVTLERARTELRALDYKSLLTDASAEDIGGINKGIKDKPLEVENGARGMSYYRSAYSRSLLTLMFAVGLVLLVVCANVANLMLVRAVARTREMGIRLAIGAGRGHLIRQMLTESAVLAVAGGGLGLLLAQWGSSALLKLAGGSSPIPLELHMNGHVLLFTAAISLGTAMLFGLVPALRATRVDLTSTLRAQGRGVTGSGGGAGRLPLGKLLVVGQVMLSMVLLVGTGMLVRSVQRLQTADIGVARDHLLIASVDANRAGYKDARLAELMPRLREAIGHVPGVQSVSMSENGIFSGTESGTTIEAEGFVAGTPDDTVVAYDDVEPGYFNTIGAHLLAGREIGAQDNATGQPAVVVNATMAKFYFPQGNAVGRRIGFDSKSYSIVGIVSDIQEQGLRDDPVRRMYIPMAQLSERPGYFNVEIRTTGDPAKTIKSVRDAIKTVDAALPINDVSPLTDLIRDSINQDLLVSRVVSFFGALALVLTALGLYGVMTYNTTRRVSEFGLRIALGAQPLDVTLMMLREALLLMVGGVVLGVPTALAATHLLRGQLFGVGMIDLPSLSVAIAVLAVSAAIAGGLPALRAARSSPLKALSEE